MENKLLDNLDPKLQDVALNLDEIRGTLRKYVKEKFNRINPFYENLFSWKENGAYVTGRKSSNVTIYNSTTVTGEVSIGDDTWIGPFCSLDGVGGLKIGKHCSISLGTQLLSHDTVKWAISGGKCDYKYAATEIGDYCFIGSHAVITKGVSIGSHCVVGAGAVVTKSFPDYSIIAGIPARKIGNVLLEENDVQFVYDENEK